MQRRNFSALYGKGLQPRDHEPQVHVVGKMPAVARMVQAGIASAAPSVTTRGSGARPGRRQARRRGGREARRTSTPRHSLLRRTVGQTLFVPITSSRYVPGSTSVCRESICVSHRGETGAARGGGHVFAGFVVGGCGPRAGRPLVVYGGAVRATVNLYPSRVSGCSPEAEEG